MIGNKAPFTVYQSHFSSILFATIILLPARIASVALDIAPGTPRNAPVSANSPTSSYVSRLWVVSCSDAARSATAIGKSYRPLLREIGRSEVYGYLLRREFITAINNRTANSIASLFTVVSGNPTMVKPGKPLLICTSMVMAGAFTPSAARV